MINRRGVNKTNFNKKGISGVILTILMIVLVLVAVVIIWGIIKNLLYKNTEQINFQSGNVLLNLKLQKVEVNSSTGNILVTVQRGSGKGDLTGIAFIISDGSNSIVVEKTINMSVLEKTSFIITHSELGNISFVKKLRLLQLLKPHLEIKWGMLLMRWKLLMQWGLVIPLHV